MSIFKCKMCGGMLIFNQGDTIGVCDSCGTKQTLPNTNDDVIANLYNRANNLRLKSEFDRAEKVYEDIVNKDDSQAEAHWGIVLCKYGIEYVDDPATGKKIPTCHRASYEAIRSDADYLAAVDYSDGEQQSIYEAEARAIDRIQKGILEIAKEEKPFDVFICYKETDENGKRTIDSTIANDIYYQLTQEGFKVFYAAITLEDKLGQEYEPYIFAALNSAKVMLVIGTKPEYFNAVWVKNEWSRYLKIIKNDRSKLLIPCYRDMDAYDLPEEFAHLQAQDMSKIGFLQDLIRNVKKLCERINEHKDPVFTNSSNKTSKDILVKRAFVYLEDGDWKSAKEYLEKILDQDPENAEAFLGKLMVDIKAKTLEEISLYKGDLTKNTNFIKAERYGNSMLREQLNEYKQKSTVEHSKAKKRGRIKKLIIAAVILLVVSAVATIATQKFVVEPKQKYDQVRNLFKQGKSQEADTLLEQIIDNPLIKKYEYDRALNLVKEKEFIDASLLMKGLNYKDSADQAKEIIENNLKKDSTLFFGEYYQLGGNLKQPIEWIVLKKENDKVLVISKYAITGGVEIYGILGRGEATWENSEIRVKLNEEFLNEAFSKKQQNAISVTTITSKDNSSYSAKKTNDKLFCLSVEEAESLFDYSESRRCKGTTTVLKTLPSEVVENGYVKWYLRPAEGIVPCVDCNGIIMTEGDEWICWHGIRPAMWIDLSEINNSN